MSNNTSILTEHPLFSTLSTQELEQLHALLSKEHYQPGATIVSEDDIVDCIYFIASGIAEVSKFSQPIATLSKGEWIGLNKHGLYSITGKRTATVVAQSDVTVLKLSLHQFQSFLDLHPNAEQSLQANVNLFARMHLLKSAAPFTELPLAQLRELASQVKAIHLPVGGIGFKEGDTGDCCYLIESGSIEISINTNSEIKPLATLEASEIFGESALLLDIPRNATATAKTATNLLVLDKSLIIHLLQTEKETAESLYMLQSARSRPERLPNVELYRQQTADKTMLITLKNPATSKYYRLSHYGLFIWEKLDGTHSLNDITMAFYHAFNIFNPTVISSLITNLHQAGFIKLTEAKQYLPPEQPPLLVRGLLKLRRIMEFRRVFTNVDPWLSQSYQRYIWPLYTKLGLSILALIALSGTICFITHTAHSAELLRQSTDKWFLIIIASIFSLMTVIPHELAHAYTTKAFGKQVHCFGLGWFWFGPMAFCDTSDMWLANRPARIAVDLAGVIFNLCIAGVASWCIYLTQHTDWQIVLWLFALMNYMAVIINLSPALELDGYYTLMDIFDKPNLRRASIEWLATTFFHKKWRKADIKASINAHRIEASYWLIALTYLLLLEILVPWLLATYLLHGLFDIRSSLLGLLIVISIVAISSLSFWVELNQNKTPTRSP